MEINKKNKLTTMCVCVCVCIVVIDDSVSGRKFQIIWQKKKKEFRNGQITTTTNDCTNRAC